MKQKTKELYYKATQTYNDLNGIDLLLSGHDKNEKLADVLTRILMDINTIYEELGISNEIRKR